MATPNQLSPREVQELAELYKKVLGYTDAIATSEANRAQSIGTARQQLELMRKELEDMTKDITEQVQAFRDIAKEISGQRDGIKETVKGFKSLRSIAEKIQYHQKDISELSNKDIESLEKKLKIEKQRFEETGKQLEKEKTALETDLARTQALITTLKNKANYTEDDLKREIKLEQIQQNITAELNKNIKAQDEIKGIVDGTDANYNATLNTLEKIKKENTEINKKMGIGGALAKSLAKNLPAPLAEYMGLDDVVSKMKEAAKDAKGIGGGLKVMGAGLKAAGGNMMSGMMSGSNPYLLIGGLLVKIAKFFIDAMFGADKQVTDLAKNLNISKESARGVRDAAFKIKENFSALVEVQKGNLLLQTEIVDTQIKFNNVLGMSVNLISGFGLEGQQVVAQLANMVSYLQLSDDELKGITNLYANTGKQIDNIKFQILGTARQQKMLTGLQIDERKVLKDVLTTSNAIRLSMKGGMDALIKSVAESQKLGKSLNELSRIGESLLNFEQSISSELEAELLLGRDLNLERARGAYFSGDMKSFQEEVNRLVKESGPDFKKNVIAQQALASALGISREELADMVTEQEKFEKFQNNMVKLSNRELEILQENLKAYGVKGKLSEATISQLKNGEITGSAFEKELKRIGLEGENLTEVLGKLSSHSLESSDAQAKFNKALESAKEIFTSFVDGGALDALANFITQFVVSVQQKGLWDTLTGGIMSMDEVEQIKLDKLQNRKQTLFQKEYAGIISDQEKAELEGIDSKIKKQLEKIVSTSENTVAEKGGKASLSFYDDYIKGNMAYLGGLYASGGNTEAAKMAETLAEAYILQQKQKEANEYASKNAEYAKRHLELLEIIAKKETNVNYDSQKASVASTKRESAIG